MIAGVSSHRVGARLESLPPRTFNDSTDLLLLALLAALSLIVHGIMIARSTCGSKDSLAYARYGRALLHPNHDLPPGEARTQLEVIRENMHHPGFPLLAGVCIEVVTLVWEAPLPQQMTLGVQSASALGGLILILPAYGIGRLLFNKGVGFGIALLTQLLPVFARNAADGLSDLTHLALAGLGLLFALRAFRRFRIGQFLLAGVFSGLAYLIRPEGLSVGLSVGALATWFVLNKTWSLKQTAAGLAALAVGGILMALPYMFVIDAITNKPTGQRVVAPFSDPPDRIKMIRGQAAVTSGPLLARMIDPEARGLSRLGLVLMALIEETSKSCHHSVLILGLIGLGALRGRFREQPELWLLVIYAGIHVGLLMMLGLKTTDGHAMGGYISERHTLPLALVLLIFAIGGLDEWLVRLPFRWLSSQPRGSRLVILIIAISCLPPISKRLHPQHYAQLKAAEFLAGRLNLTQDHLYDPYEWVSFYTGHSLYYIRPDWYRTAGHGIWLIWEVGDQESPSKAQRWRDTRRLLHERSPMLMYPEPGSPLNEQKGTVQVYYLPFTEEEVRLDRLEMEQALADENNPDIPPEKKVKLRRRY